MPDWNNRLGATPIVPGTPGSTPSSSSPSPFLPSQPAAATSPIAAAPAVITPPVAGPQPVGTRPGPYLSRDALVEPPQNPAQAQVAGMEQQIAQRQSFLQQQPLTPEGTALSREFTADMNRIRDMQAQGYPHQHVADYMAQSLKKLDSRWSPGYVQQQPTFQEMIANMVGINPVTGKPAQIILRNGQPQIQEFEEQQPQESAAQSGTATASAGVFAGTPAASSAPTPSSPNQGLTEGQPAPQGSSLPVLRSREAVRQFPGGWWQDVTGKAHKKPTRQEMIEQHFQQNTYTTEDANGNTVTYQLNRKTGDWKAIHVSQKPKPDKSDTMTAEQEAKHRERRAESLQRYRERWSDDRVRFAKDEPQIREGMEIAVNRDLDARKQQIVAEVDQEVAAGKLTKPGRIWGRNPLNDEEKQAEVDRRFAAEVQAEVERRLDEIKPPDKFSDYLQRQEDWLEQAQGDQGQAAGPSAAAPAPPAQQEPTPSPQQPPQQQPPQPRPAPPPQSNGLQRLIAAAKAGNAKAQQVLDQRGIQWRQ